MRGEEVEGFKGDGIRLAFRHRMVAFSFIFYLCRLIVKVEDGEES